MDVKEATASPRPPETRSWVWFLLQKLPYKNPTHLAQQQEPWCRLSSTATITSMRRDACFFDPEIPKDDLDFRLSALYNHHSGTFKNKSEILIHQETIQDTHGIKIQFPGESLPPPQPPPITSQANIRHWINPKKESIHSIQGSIGKGEKTEGPKADGWYKSFSKRIREEFLW
uniref:Cilia and flagella associated protein 276 n=1 Tax=Sus scrofa TaxID=9823 RepID=A0A8D1UAR3_PIG